MLAVALPTPDIRQFTLTFWSRRRAAFALKDLQAARHIRDHVVQGLRTGRQPAEPEL